jgi:hypothetical protein
VDWQGKADPVMPTTESSTVSIEGVSNIRLAPDGNRFAVSLRDQTADIWI